MKVWNISESEIYRIAEMVDVRIYNFRKEGNAFAFTLRLNPSKKWQKLSASALGWQGKERKTSAVCFHGHYNFMRELFRVNENARIKTAFCDYRGLASFLELANSLGYRNIGSLMYPVQFRECCYCADTGDDYIMEESIPNPQLRMASMRQSDMLKCPHCIIDPTHYRADGSCRCNDPKERERLIREYDYTLSDFPD